MDDEGDDDPVPLPNVNAAILKKVQDTQTTNTHRPIHTSHLTYHMHILMVIAVQQVCLLKLEGWFCCDMLFFFSFSVKHKMVIATGVFNVYLYHTEMVLEVRTLSAYEMCVNVSQSFQILHNLLLS